MNRFKKLLTVGVLSMTVLSMTAVVSPVLAATTLSEGDIVMKATAKAGDAVYAYVNGMLSPFPNEETYKTYLMLSNGKADWSKIKKITVAEFNALSFGKNVTYKPGTNLIKFSDSDKNYVVETGGTIREISDATAAALYGSTWKSMVATETGYLRGDYTVGTAYAATDKYPAGTVVKKGTDLFYWDGANYRKFANGETTLVMNGFNPKFVMTAPASMTVTAGGTAISAAETALMAYAVRAGAGSNVATGTGSGLTVALASDTPAAATYVRNSSNTAVSQSVASFTKINFTASNDGDVVVTTVKLTRAGISADTDLSTVYLYDGTTRLAEHTSISNKVITFTNSAGLFTIPKGTTKSVTVKADIAGGSSTVSGIVLGVNAATDIVAGTATVTGSFPVNGNSMGVGTVTDLGYLNIATVNSSNLPSTIDPGVTNTEIFRFNVTANSQQMDLESLRLTMVGTVSTGDVTNFTLKDTTGVQIGTTVASMGASKEVVFDTTATPYTITSGQTKTLVVYANVPNGSGRNFRFTIRKVADVVVKDHGYGIYTAPLYNSAAFVLIDPVTVSGSSTYTTINNGTITSGIATDTPVGNIADGATGATITKYTLKANGEDIKVNYIRIASTASEDFKNGKLLWDGSQVGSTDTVVSTSTANVFAVNQVIAAGKTVTVTYQADTINNRTGNAFSSGSILVSMNASTTGDATGQASLSDVSITAVTGKTLTLSGGTLTVAKNLAFGNMSTATPTGVKGSLATKVGSFIVTAGTGEGSSINQIAVRDNNSSHSTNESFGHNFQNLKLMTGSTQLGTTIGTLAHDGGDTYTFNLSPAYALAAGQQLVVDVYADILSGAPGYYSLGNAVGLEVASITGTGTLTSTATTVTKTANQVPLQTLYISANGNLTITANTIDAAQLVMGSTENTIGSFNFNASTSSEAINISVIKVKASANGTSFSNVKFYDGTTLLGTVASFDAAAGYATLNLANNWVIPKGQNKILTVKADVNTVDSATSSTACTFSINSNSDITSIGAGSGQSITETVTSATGITATPVKTKITVSLASNSPSGAQSGMAGQVVAIFNFANSSNVAQQTATVTDLALTISTSGTWTQWTNDTSKSITIRKNSTTGTLLGTSAAQMAPVSVAAGTGWGGATLTDFDIPSGESVNLYVIVDTSNAPSTTGRLTASLAAGSVTWNDGTTEGTGITTINSLPVNGGTLTY